MTIYSDTVPEENLAIYKLLYNIEVGLREFIIEVLEARCGPRWWKERLPSDVLEAYREGRKYEREIRWCQLVPHHPMYYIDFPHLRKVIERKDNWEDVFQIIFKRKEILIGTLSELEPIRNKIAHNRKATQGDLRIVGAAYRKLVAGIGEEHFTKLVARCTLASDLPESLLHLWTEAESAFRCCTACRPLERLEVWEKTQASWWFDADYLGHELGAIREYFETLVAYGELPRSRGSGYRIEAWLKSKDLEGKYTEAMQEFSAMLNNIEGV